MLLLTAVYIVLRYYRDGIYSVNVIDFWYLSPIILRCSCFTKGCQSIHAIPTLIHKTSYLMPIHHPLTWKNSTVSGSDMSF